MRGLKGYPICEATGIIQQLENKNKHKHKNKSKRVKMTSHYGLLLKKKKERK
jgi:hypothetical protein